MSSPMRITNDESIIDSRDVIARIEFLESSANAGYILEEEREELTVLRKLAEKGDSATNEWQHTVLLIRDSHFKMHAMDTAEEVGAINWNATWPLNCIDWERAERELKQGYTSIDFDGVTYWVRS